MSLYEYRSLFTHKEKDKLLLLKYCSVHVTLCSLTFSSVETVSLSLEMRLHTCCRERPRNSSPCTTSVKRCSERHKDAKSYHDTFFFFFRAGETSIAKDDSQSAVWTPRSLPANVWAWLRSCVHVCRSAKALMPRQLVGWSWDCRNSQQTWRTSISWRRLAAGSRTCNYDTHINA